MSRLNMDVYHMSSAWLLSQHSSCCSKKVGAILVKDNRILSSGYNGTRSKHENCDVHAEKNGWLTDKGYLNSTYRQEHRMWSSINEYHAEANTIDNASRHDVKLDGGSLFVTLSPCVECCKRIINSGIKRVVYSVEYDYAVPLWEEFLIKNGVVVEQISLEQVQRQYPYINVDYLVFDNVEE